MPTKLTTTIGKIATLQNKENAKVISDYQAYMEQRGSSERHLNNQLKAAIYFAQFLGPNRTFLSVKSSKEILEFLDKKIKTEAEDPEKKWITTWNDYLGRVKRLYRWLYNNKKKNLAEADWKTPAFARIREKKTKRLSPYSETEIWDRDELLTLVKYVEHIRDKAILTLLWDMDGRNHELTMLKIKNIRLMEKHGRGEIPPESKTGSGPFMMTCSFTYTRDWLKVHPHKNNPDAALICSLHTGRPIKPDALWSMLHEKIRPDIIRRLKDNEITDPVDREMLERLIRTKKWNPYCIRHSAITYDAQSIPEFGVRLKARWSMDSDQPKRYIKRRMGKELADKILARDGIVIDEAVKQKPAILVCPECEYVNAPDNKTCSECTWPLDQAILKRIKVQDQKEVDSLKEQMMQIQKELALIRQNPGLANATPEMLSHLRAHVKPDELARVQVKEKESSPEIAVVDG